MKRTLPLFFLLALILVPFVSAEKFRIADVTYNITGQTRVYPLEQDVPVSTTRIFTSYNELHTYVSDLEQQYINERVFAYATVTVRYDYDIGPDGVQNVHLSVSLIDSHHFLALPYVKYDSNDGLITKLKMKDTNFLGTISTLNFDIDFSMEQDDVGLPIDYVLGTSFDYDYPFKAGPFKATWSNSDSIDYTVGDSTPEFSFESGLTFELPFDGFSLTFEFDQGLTRDFDYLEYGDSTYLTEDAKVSLPVYLADIDNWGKVTWTPYISYTRNWDNDGIDPDNDDLSSPLYLVGHTLETSRINWYGNFRQGLDLSLGQSMGYNSLIEKYVLNANGELKLFKAFKYVGFSTDLYTFGYLNSSEKIGSRLRGIRDDQYFKDSSEYALKTSAAIVCNFDMPVHVFSTDWVGLESFIFGSDSSITKAFRFMRNFDFELQVSPFFDFALTKNDITGRLFSYKDGFYSGGLEMIVYPAKWSSLMVRASVGIDAGRKIIAKYAPSLIDTSWRSNVSAYEISFGIGLAY